MAMINVNWKKVIIHNYGGHYMRRKGKNGLRAFDTKPNLSIAQKRNDLRRVIYR